MKKSLVWSFVFLIVVLSIQSCRELPTAPQTATIKGQALTAQWAGNNDFPFNGITVSLDGTNISSITDDSGYYELDNVPSGTYNVTFSKPGYGSIHWYGSEVQGGGNAPIYWEGAGNTFQTTLYYAPTLYKQPDFVATLQSFTIVNTFAGQNDGPFLQAKGTYSGSYPQLVPNMTYLDFAIYYSQHSDVSFSPRHYATYLCSNDAPYGSPDPNTQIDTISKTFTITWPTAEIEDVGHFSSGDSIYAATYGAPYNGGIPDYPDYWDPEIDGGIYVLTSINQTPSPVIGLKIP